MRQRVKSNVNSPQKTEIHFHIVLLMTFDYDQEYLCYYQVMRSRLLVSIALSCCAVFPSFCWQGLAVSYSGYLVSCYFSSGLKSTNIFVDFFLLPRFFVWLHVTFGQVGLVYMIQDIPAGLWQSAGVCGMRKKIPTLHLYSICFKSIKVEGGICFPRQFERKHQQFLFHKVVGQNLCLKLN